MVNGWWISVWIVVRCCFEVYNENGFCKEGCCLLWCGLGVVGFSGFVVLLWWCVMVVVVGQWYFVVLGVVQFVVEEIVVFVQGGDVLVVQGLFVGGDEY